jgi:DNA-binding XRE family transcriptional regulator
MNCELLKETRKQAGITQEAMAKKLGYKGKGSYCLLENGDVKCTVEQAKIIAETIGMSMEKYQQIFLTRKIEILEPITDKREEHT